jgi:hypothetical protein
MAIHLFKTATFYKKWPRWWPPGNPGVGTGDVFLSIGGIQISLTAVSGFLKLLWATWGHLTSPHFEDVGLGKGDV